MDVNKITRKMKASCNNENVQNMLVDLFMYQLGDPGRWKEKYREIITKYACKEMDNKHEDKED